MKKRIVYDRTAAGERLQKCRTQFRWTRKDVAERCGLTEKYYSDIERGYCGMSIETLVSLADLYGLSMDYLLRGEGGKVSPAPGGIRGRAGPSPGHPLGKETIPCRKSFPLTTGPCAATC